MTRPPAHRPPTLTGAVCYIRVLTGWQAIHGHSLSEQQRLIREHCERSGLPRGCGSAIDVVR